jgi:hypothetical protein
LRRCFSDPEGSICADAFVLAEEARCNLLPINLVSDLEAAIATGSKNTGAMLHRITDLFLLYSGHYSAEQISVYDDVLKALIDKVEVAARAQLAKRLAPIDGAPTNTIRSLALDDSIEVAEPILSHSNALDDKALADCIAIKGQEHLLAIATRNTLSEMVSDRLVKKGDKKVLGTLVSNPGAKISDHSFGLLVQKSAGDDWLTECVAIRNDIPDHHFRQLVSTASNIVRQILITTKPKDAKLIRELLPDIVLPAATKTPDPLKDYRTAELVVKSQPLTEAVVNGFARAKKIEEVIVSIAQLSGLSTTEIERLIMGNWSSPVAIIFKAIGFHIATIDAIYRSRLSSGDVIRNDGIQTKAEFIAVSRPTAERIMRFFQVRKSAEHLGAAHLRTP